MIATEANASNWQSDKCLTTTVDLCGLADKGRAVHPPSRLTNLGVGAVDTDSEYPWHVDERSRPLSHN